MLPASSTRDCSGCAGADERVLALQVAISDVAEQQTLFSDSPPVAVIQVQLLRMLSSDASAELFTNCMQLTRGAF